MNEKKKSPAHYVMPCDTGAYMLNGGSVTFNGQSAMIANASVIKAETFSSTVFFGPTVVVHSKDAQAPNPPPIPHDLLRPFARSKRDLAAIGDINELYDRDRARFGRARARRLYWAETLKFLWPLLGRAFSRVIKWAVIIDALKRHLLG
jgi:hypothetical protein